MTIILRIGAADYFKSPVDLFIEEEKGRIYRTYFYDYDPDQTEESLELLAEMHAGKRAGATIYIPPQQNFSIALETTGDWDVQCSVKVVLRGELYREIA